jgi:hypothetical protein
VSTVTPARSSRGPKRGECGLSQSPIRCIKQPALRTPGNLSFIAAVLTRLDQGVGAGRSATATPSQPAGASPHSAGRHEPTHTAEDDTANPDRLRFSSRAVMMRSTSP